MNSGIYRVNTGSQNVITTNTSKLKIKEKSNHKEIISNFIVYVISPPIAVAWALILQFIF